MPAVPVEAASRRQRLHELQREGTNTLYLEWGQEMTVPASPAEAASRW